MPSIPMPLLESLKKDRCILFAGSGLSIAAGYPSWSELVDLLVKEAAAAYPEKAASLTGYAANNKDPLMIAEFARGKLGLQRCAMHLRQVFDRRLPPSPVHKLIAATNYRAIITTNYDKLLETAITFERGWFPTVFTSESVSLLGTVLYEGHFFVYELHGDVAAAESIVLTSQDYDRLILRYPHVRSFLQAIFLNYAVLFVGYSLHDPDFQLVLKELRLIFECYTPTQYALLPDAHEFTAEHLMARMNIQVIPYSSADGHGGVNEFLRSLQQAAPYREAIPVTATSVSQTPAVSGV